MEDELSESKRMRAVAPDGVEIVGAVTGEGPALLLVYGAMMEQTGWERLLPHLPGHAVYTYDRRGRGESGNTREYSVRREVDDLQAFAALVPRPFDVFAHSSGVLLALHAVMQGLDPRRMVLYEPPIASTREPPLPPDLGARILDLAGAGDRDGALEAFMREGMWFTAEDVARLRASPRWQDQLRYAETGAYDVILHATFELRRDALTKIAVPMLMLMGAESPPWMQEGVRRLAALLPDCPLEPLAGQDHNPQFTAPDVLSKRIVEYLRQPAKHT
jgi:pimeloyl-ACP methyl ester carboxylesterase